MAWSWPACCCCGGRPTSWRSSSRDRPWPPAAADAVCAGADRPPAPRARRQRDPRLGPGACGWAAGCCCASRTTIGSAVGPSTRPRSSTTSTGSDSSPTCSRPRRFVPDRARDGSQTARPGTGRRCAAGRAGLVYGCRCTRREIEAAGDASPANCAIRARAARSGCRWSTASAGGCVVDPGDGAFDDARPRADHPRSGGAVR